MSEPVFIPLKPGQKDPLSSGWAEPGYVGVDPTDYGRHVGIRTENLVVVDADTAEMVEHWREEGFPTVEITTARGVHFYYRRPKGCDLRSGTLVPGLDIKTGIGSYVVAPGAIHPSGVVYTGPSITSEFIEALPLAPEARIADLARRRRSQTSSDGSGWELIPEGQRNTTLHSLASLMRKQGASALAILKTLAGINRAFCQPPLDLDEVRRIAISASGYDPDPDHDGDVLIADTDLLPVQYARDMELKPPPGWLWRPFIPRKRLTLLDGAEGIGKTMFLNWLVVAVTTGRGLDDPMDAGTVLWLGTEDDPEEDILGRLFALGYDPDRHHQVGFINPLDFSAGVPGQIERLEATIEDAKARLVIFDPIRSFLADPNDRDFSFNNEAKVRPPMEAMAQLARRTGATILGSHHWRKSTEDGVKLAAAGSAAFSQVVRHRMSMVWVGNADEGQGAIGVSKTNMIKRGAGVIISYRVREINDDLAVWEPGEVQRDRDLDAWIDRQRERWRTINADVVIGVDPDEIIDSLLATPGLSVNRPMLQDYGLSQDEARELMKELQVDPRFAKAGRVLIVRGRATEDER